jgi:hypothetical protein
MRELRYAAKHMKTKMKEREMIKCWDDKKETGERNVLQCTSPGMQ